jgi:hypothetical protein
MLGFLRYISKGMFRIARAFFLFACGCLFFSVDLGGLVSNVDSKGSKGIASVAEGWYSVTLGRTHNHSTIRSPKNLGLPRPRKLMEPGLDNAKLPSPFPEHHDWR